MSEKQQRLPRLSHLRGRGESNLSPSSGESRPALTAGRAAMASLPATMRALMSEVRARGTWGTIRALKMNKFGSLHYLVGEDEQGNRFFENQHETFGRDRWVEYSDIKNFDSSNISPRWHAWLHKMTDDVVDPSANPTYVRAVTRNRTGTPNAYVPTAHRNSGRSSGPAPSKFQSWDPNATAKSGEKPGLKDVLDLK
jgi:NADH:ubiquinone oxidoreductase subunit